ncbi:hypothetical protein H9L39_10640 [Fusarium oxysporum f. sp. albedinis]|nr:hypothetical protein H9L39_10640 [Fusarium oxysporum f. sp. albedinis]
MYERLWGDHEPLTKKKSIRDLRRDGRDVPTTSGHLIRISHHGQTLLSSQLPCRRMDNEEEEDTASQPDKSTCYQE